ncbi:MAG: hypothetical protein AABY22_11305 [Nanoarchaeota archaeon]
MKLTIKEAYNLLRTVETRIEWIKDNPDDVSIEEYEKDSLKSIHQKLVNFYIGDSQEKTGEKPVAEQAGLRQTKVSPDTDEHKTIGESVDDDYKIKDMFPDYSKNKLVKNKEEVKDG